jgi:hypothetical protein
MTSCVVLSLPKKQYVHHRHVCMYGLGNPASEWLPHVAPCWAASAFQQGDYPVVQESTLLCISSSRSSCPIIIIISSSCVLLSCAGEHAAATDNMVSTFWL